MTVSELIIKLSDLDAAKHGSQDVVFRDPVEDTCYGIDDIELVDDRVVLW